MTVRGLGTLVPVLGTLVLGGLWWHGRGEVEHWRTRAKEDVKRAESAERGLAVARAGIVALGKVAADAYRGEDMHRRRADSIRATRRPLPPIVPAACEVWAAEVSRCEAETVALRAAADSAERGRIADSSALAVASTQLREDSATIRDLRKSLAEGVKVTGGCRKLLVLPCVRPSVALEVGARLPDLRQFRAAVDAEVAVGNVAVFARGEVDSLARGWVGGRWYVLGRR